MKNLQDFDFNQQYPMHMDGETLLTREDYREFLIRKGYAIDPVVSAVLVKKEEIVPDNVVTGRSRKKESQKIKDQILDITVRAETDSKEMI
jgi:hypothetical protein